jgi:hypothetical protein
MKYQKRFKERLMLSEAQLDQMSCIKAISLATAFNNIKFKDIPNLNPEWLKNYRITEVPIKYGAFDVKKAKKGYVITFKWNWRSKGIKRTKLICRKCKKSDMVNDLEICEKCEKKLKSKRQYQKFVWG